MTSYRSHNTSVFVMLFLSSLFIALCGAGSAVQIELKTKKYEGIIPKSIEITCIPDAVHSCAKEILALQVTRKNEEKLVTLTQNSDVVYNPLLRNNLKAEGFIAKEVAKSRLSVTFSDVLEEDSGQYSCVLVYLDEWGILKQDKATDNFTMTGYNLNDYVRYLMGKVSSLDASQTQKENGTTELQERLVENKEFMERLRSQEKTTAELTERLQTQVNITSDLQKQLVEQEEVLQRQGEATAELREQLVEQRELVVRQQRQLACSGAISTSNKCYIVVGEKLNYDDARAYCNAIGGTIAVPMNHMEAVFIHVLARKEWTWVGITDKAVEGKWVLENGKEVTWTNWNGVEPDGGPGEHCVQTYNGYKWIDIGCSHINPILVCEKQL